jgi:hypothetical protein
MAQTRIQRSRSKRPSEKAAFHQITGAGKSRVKRPFFGLAASDTDVIVKEVDQTIANNLAREGSRSS